MAAKWSASQRTNSQSAPRSVEVPPEPDWADEEVRLRVVQVAVGVGDVAADELILALA